MYRSVTFPVWEPISIFQIDEENAASINAVTINPQQHQCIHTRIYDKIAEYLSEYCTLQSPAFIIMNENDYEQFAGELLYLLPDNSNNQGWGSILANEFTIHGTNCVIIIHPEVSDVHIACNAQYDFLHRRRTNYYEERKKNKNKSSNERADSNRFTRILEEIDDQEQD